MPDRPILIDTDILIDISRGVGSATQVVEGYRQGFVLAISVVTQLELMVGCENKKELTQLSEFLDRFQILPISEEVSAKTVELFRKYRLSHGVQIPDMLIASTALIHRIHLVSKNRKDFSFIENLDFIPYSNG